ncbi:SRPBCC family protein [Pontibacter sp. CAU 1760]
MNETNNFAIAQMMIRKPVSEVFEAITNPGVTTKFWFTHSTGKLAEGKEVEWTWEMYHVTVPVSVKTIVPNERIVIEWGNKAQQSTVEFAFKALSEAKTYLTIKNYDFKSTGDDLLSAVIDSTGGFALFIAALKAYLEHNIQLNLVADKFPKELKEA